MSSQARIIREQELPIHRHKTESKNYPGHEERMDAHIQKAAEVIKELAEPWNSMATSDKDLGIPPEAVDIFRVRLFRMLYKELSNELDMTVRFGLALAESCCPVKDKKALKRWYKEHYLNRRKKK